MSIQQNLINFECKDYGHANDDLTLPNSYEVIDCSLGTNPFKNVFDLAEVFHGIDFNKCKSYQYSDIFTPFKDAINIRHKVKIDYNQIFFGHGLIVVLERLATKFCDKSKPCLGISPQFTYFIDDYRLVGGQYEELNILEDQDYINTIKNRLKQGNYSTFYLDNPNNPTGKVINLEDIREIAKICDQKDILFILLPSPL